MSEVSLLPANALPQERALELTTSRIGDVPVPMREQWNPNTCPEHLLTWLAWAFSVDEWSADWPLEQKRQTVRDAVEVQSRKGTPWSIKRVLANAGYPDAMLQEGRAGFYDGSELHDGAILYGSASAWAEYRCVLERPITNSQADQVRRILANTAPARCNLYDFSYAEANNSYNGAIYYDGTYNHGTA